MKLSTSNKVVIGQIGLVTLVIMTGTTSMSSSQGIGTGLKIAYQQIFSAGTWSSISFSDLIRMIWYQDSNFKNCHHMVPHSISFSSCQPLLCNKLSYSCKNSLYIWFPVQSILMSALPQGQGLFHILVDIKCQFDVNNSSNWECFTYLSF